MMTATQIVLPVPVGEIPSALPFMEAYIVASGLPIVFDHEKALSSWHAIYTKNAGVLLGLYEEQLVGIFGAEIIESKYGTGYAVNESVWWVDPAHRSGPGGLWLLDSAEVWAHERGLPMMGGAYDNARAKVMDRMYVRRGYRRVSFGMYLKPYEAAHV